MFKLDEKEQITLAKWFETRPDVEYKSSIGGRYTFCFTPTGLGEICVVKDNATGDEINVTNFDNW